MEPTSFEQENTVLDPPDGMSVEDCSPLSVHIGKDVENNPVCISCWKLTEEEMKEVIKTGRLWLIVCGYTMPPVHLTGLIPFQKAE